MELYHVTTVTNMLKNNNKELLCLDVCRCRGLLVGVIFRGRYFRLMTPEYKKTKERTKELDKSACLLEQQRQELADHFYNQQKC